MGAQDSGSLSKGGFHIYFYGFCVQQARDGKFPRQWLNVRPEVVYFGPRQGRRKFLTGGVLYATSRIKNFRERSIGPKDAVSGWTLGLNLSEKEKV